MVLQVKEGIFAGLFKDKSDAKPHMTISARQGINLKELSRTGDGIWIEVEAEFPNPLHCFVKVADVVEVTDLKFQSVDLWSFVYFCTVASETFNQHLKDPSGGVSRDYILALALVLNGLEDKGLTDEVLQEFDPFHFTEAEWKKFCESSGNTSNYQDFDRFDPLAQIDGAVFVTSQSTSKIVHALDDPADEGDPPMPNSMDLFLVRMLGDAGIAALKDLETDSSLGSKPWASFVSAAGGDPAALKIRYPKFLDGRDKTSVDQVLGLIETAFDKAYVNVAKIVLDIFPEEVPPPQTGGPPKWLEIARGEEARKPNVVKTGDPRIVEFFKDTDFGSGATPTTAWCGAFAAFCMKSAGQPVPKGAASARSWIKWGKPIPNATPDDKIPQGAVVVFKRGTDPKKGHVSFFVGGVDGDSRHVPVLGGNQHDTVKKSPFPRSDIIGIRVPADMPSGPSAAMPSGESIVVPPGASLFQAKAPGIMDKLMKDFELSEEQAAGVLGNIGTECNGFKNFQEIKPKGGGRGGFGWCQWTGMTPKNPRRKNFEKFCEDHHVEKTSDEGNYGFLAHELRTSESKALEFLKAKKTLKEAVRIFEQKFERAGVENFVSRDQFAQIALKAHKQSKAKSGV